MATDTTLRPGELKEILLREIASADLGAEDVSEVGTVLEVRDGIARIYGLKSAVSSEMLEFTAQETGETVAGLVLNLEEDNVGAAVLGDYLKLKEGDAVRRTGRLLEVPAGPAMLGRVVDALGRPVDGRGSIQASTSRQVEMVAPGIIVRQPVKEPMQTGIKSIDAMIPIGRGQRELIIGDRGTGKTAIGIDTIINQKGQGVVCVYVAIGQKRSTVASVVEKLRAAGALEYTVVVVASAADPAPLQYIAPYTGCAIAEYFMYEEGKATLCVYDDLSKQAAAYRQLSLILRRPGGRRRMSESWRYAAACLERSSYTQRVAFPSSYMKYSAMAQPVYGAMNWSGAGSEALATTTTVYSSAPASRSFSTTEATVERFWPMATYTQTTPWPFWLMMVSTPMAVLPVPRSPMMSSRWPRPIGIIASIDLMPVCIGSFTGCRTMMPGAMISTSR